jgi:hypothetical protein
MLSVRIDGHLLKPVSPRVSIGVYAGQMARGPDRPLLVLASGFEKLLMGRSEKQNKIYSFPPCLQSRVACDHGILNPVNNALYTCLAEVDLKKGSTRNQLYHVVTDRRRVRDRSALLAQSLLKQPVR